jgi:hypothetical protein
MEAAPDALVVVDACGRITLMNAQTERLFGFSRDELPGAISVSAYLRATCPTCLNNFIAPATWLGASPAPRSGWPPHGTSSSSVTISVDTREGVGSTFTVCLPISPG